MSANIINNPNDKSYTCTAPTSPIFNDFSKIVISRPKTNWRGKPLYSIEGASPLTDEIFSTFKGLNRIDFIIENDLISVSGLRKLGNWKKEDKQEFADMINSNLGNAIHPKTLKETFDEVAFFVPDNVASQEIKKTFESDVKKSLDAHGGSLEIKDISIYDDGEVDIEILLMGSCADCDSATTQTLEGAKNAIIAQIEILKKQYDDLADLKFGNLETTSIEKGFWMPRP